jgi:hypothetical protein
MIRTLSTRLVLAIAAFLLISFTVSIADAQDDPAAIFTKAREQFKDGEYEEALKGFERVMELSESPNAVFYSAKALRELGRFAEAYARFERARNEAAARADEEKRYLQTRDSADAALRDLEPRIAKLVITIPAAVTGAEVNVDGHPLESSAWGESVPMMPGEHSIDATAPGYDPVSTTVSLKRGKTKTVPLFASGGSSSEPEPDPITDKPDTPEDDGNLLLWGAIVGGVGVAALAVGGVFGGLSLAKKSEREDNCDGLACNEQGLAAAEDGTTFGNVATAGFVVGGVAVAVGVTLIVLSLSGDDAPESDAWHPTRPTTLRW